ncbi:MAG TPA: histidine kinase [Catalimonadaceae bacterium]|nr:histidine kinase [Catalimonadaceae bacterium]HPI10973.1 histidine kinase [Catalimonadaceae bacterium]
MDFLLLASLFFIGQGVEAQILPFRPHWLSGSLPSSEIYGIHQDRKGYLWIRTDVGLFRANGREVHLVEDKLGKSTFGVYALAEDEQGKIWFSTSDGRIGFAEGDSIRYLNPKAQNQPFFPIEREYFYLLIYEKPNKLYAASSDGLAVFNTQTLPITVTNAATENRITDDLGVRFLPNGVIVQNFHRPEPTQRVQKLDLDLHSYHKDSTKTVIKLPVATSIKDWRKLSVKHQDGFVVSEGPHLFFVRGQKVEESITLDQNILELFSDSAGGLWIGVHKTGVLYFPDGRISSEPVPGLKGLSVTGICPDRENGVWATTLEKGVFRCPNPAVRWFSEPELNDRITLLDNVGGRIFAAGKSNRFAVFGKDKHRMIALPTGSPLLEFTSVLEDRNRFLVCGKGFLRDYSNDLRSNTTLKFKNQNTILSLSQLMKAANGKVLGFFHKSIFEIQGMDILPFGFKCQSSMKWGLVWPDQIVRLCTDKGLYRFTGDSLVAETQLSKLRDENLTHQFLSRSGLVWLCTKGNGIWCWDGKKLKSFTRKDGLSSDICFHACEDLAGNIWIGTNKGLNCMSLKKSGEYQIQIFGEESGLPSVEILRIEYLDGDLFCGASQGLSRIPVSVFTKQNTRIPVWLVSRHVNGGKWPEGDVLQPGQNQLVFQFDIPGFGLNKAPGIKYRLLGLQSPVLFNTSGEIRYQNLPSGTYTLEVWADSSPVQAKPDFELRFQILQPFYEKWWFYLFCIAFLSILIWQFIRWQIGLYRKKEEEREKINRLLNQYQLSALKAQMNPHFIFNAINSIQQFVLTNQSESAYRYLTRFSQLIRKVLNQSGEEKHSLQQELDIISLYVQLEQLRFQNRFHYVLEVDPNLDMTEIDVPPLLLQPYVENAIWHGLMPLPPTQEGKVEILIHKTMDGIEIRILDNGIGREASGKNSRKGHSSKGMGLNEKRIQLQNLLLPEARWQLEVKDVLSGGTEVILRLKQEPD